jgi:HEAT repeat protein
MGLKKAGEPGALRRIETREYPRDHEGLVAQLTDAEPAVRRWAARDLAAFPAAAERLCARLAGEPDASVRAVLFSSVARMGGNTVVECLLPLLRSEDAALRNGAIEVLGGLPDAVAPRMETLLRDADPDVRIMAVNLLGLLPHPRVPQWLAQVLQADQHANVIGAAIEVLAEVGTTELAEPLRKARQRFAEHPYIAFAADLALERIEAA